MWFCPPLALNRGGGACAAMKHIPRRRFGQHFLVSPGVIRKIVEAIAPQVGDTVVEIGPGLGALTAPLLERLDHLHVIEIDRDLIARLRERFPSERLTIHAGDALAFDFSAFKSAGRLKVVGNLPYNISTPLLFHLARYADQIAEMHFMLQKEVVDRMVAAPGSAAYGRLSVMLQYRFRMERLCVVPPGAFDPPPQVDSALVRMIPVDFAKAPSETVVRDAALFARLVMAAFSQRRKMLRNTLREFGGEACLAKLGIPPTARAEELSVADFVRLANAVKSDG